eukprot:8478925-Pyramimonas_sp.AAC.1
MPVPGEVPGVFMARSVRNLCHPADPPFCSFHLPPPFLQLLLFLLLFPWQSSGPSVIVLLPAGCLACSRSLFLASASLGRS